MGRLSKKSKPYEEHIFLGIFPVLVAAARADDKPVEASKLPVSIKVVQAADLKADMVEVRVINSSKDTIIVDRNAFQELDYKASKDVSEKGSGELKELHTDSLHGSVGGHWSWHS